MNILNNLLVATRPGVGAKTRAGIKAGTRSEPRVGLQDRAEEVLPKLGPLTEPGSLASLSSTGLIKGWFRQGEQRGQDPPGAILVDDLGSMTKFSSERTD